MQTPKRDHSYSPKYPLSKTWTLKRSQVPEVDLKYLQQAVQDFLSTLLPKGEHCKVYWKGQDKVPGFTVTGANIIYLSYGPLKDREAPVDSIYVDIVAGIAIHEAGHIAIKRVRSLPNGWDIPLISNVVEDIWIEYRASSDFPVLGAYIDRVREYYRRDQEKEIAERMQDPSFLSVNEVIGLWIAQALFEVDIFPYVAWRTGPDLPALKSCLQSLLKVTFLAIKELNESPQKYRRIVQAAQTALNKYAEKIRDLMDQGLEPQPGPQVISSRGQGGPHEEGEGGPGQEGSGEDEAPSPEAGPSGLAGGSGHKPGQEQGSEQGDGQDAGGDGQDTSGEGDGDDDDDDDEEHAHSHLPGRTGSAPVRKKRVLKPSICKDEFMQELPPELAQRVWKATEHEMEDIRAIAGTRGRFISIKPGRGNPVKIEGTAAEQVRDAFESRRHHMTSKLPFQESGRINRRTLAHVLMGRKEIFEQEVMEEDPDLALGVLIDASGSIMSGSYWDPDTYQLLPMRGQWDIILECSQALVEAFRESEEVDLQVMAYSSGVIYRLYEPGWESLHLQDVHPTGGTPSVPALRVMARALSQAGRRETLILHLTDGEPNDEGGPNDMARLVAALEDKGIRIIGIGAGVPEKALANQYRRYFAIRNFSELPGKLRKIIEAL